VDHNPWHAGVLALRRWRLPEWCPIYRQEVIAALLTQRNMEEAARNGRCLSRRRMRDGSDWLSRKRLDHFIDHNGQ
jgi:hypothetical protein